MSAARVAHWKVYRRFGTTSLHMGIGDWDMVYVYRPHGERNVCLSLYGQSKSVTFYNLFAKELGKCTLMCLSMYIAHCL